MKNVFCVVILVVLLSSARLHAAQRFTAIPSKSHFVAVEYTYCDLYLKTKSSELNLFSHMLGITHKGAGQNLVYMEHFGFINWESEKDDFGIYIRATVMYRNNIENPFTNHELLLGGGISANFEFGTRNSEVYSFGQFGPIFGLIYQIPEKGFSFYLIAIAEFIVLSQMGEINLSYKAAPFFGAGFGLEYVPIGTNYNFGVELAFVREFSIDLYFGIRI